VVVRDTTPPAIACPPNVSLEVKEPTAVQLGTPTVSDAVTAAPVVSSTAHSGDDFPLGMTPVTFTATDAAGNAAQCTMTVTLTKAAEPAKSCGCGNGSAGTTGLLGLLALALRRRAGARARP
jgi:hypothetical protein